MVGRRLAGAGGRVTAVLGPTNTGKTHHAVERMLDHANGVIGLPLRLLAREVYDRIVRITGPRSVALITGEEKIRPPRADYFVCTVEAMPSDIRPDFLAVDEIQLCTDPERGHVFTDRLLHARGRQETMFMGAETMRGMIRLLVPEADMISRPRFSDLRHAGPRKLSRLPRRSAIVTFSAAEVYAIAELARRQRGGAAVVLGALSPRTRNAQAALYQSGEVDFLVATDAIGMGLNMDVEHIAFAGLRKFDGIAMRGLRADEVGQIAGRAGRYLANGSFGTTAACEDLPGEIVEAVEAHRFDPVRRLRWRNRDLNFASLDALGASLVAPTPSKWLQRVREPVDEIALHALARDADIGAVCTGPDAVRRLWAVCQIPDFRKTLADAHHRLLRDILLHLAVGNGHLPDDWLARQVDRLDRVDGDIDALAHRIAHVRTWTFVANRADWLADAEHWQARTRAIEDRLSDALHAALTQRFVDRRTSALIRGLRDRRQLLASVGGDGAVLVEGQYVGQLDGLRFRPDATLRGPDGRILRAAANRVLSREIARRAASLASAADDEIAWRDDGQVWWRGAPVARLARGIDPLRPALALLPSDHVSGPLREAVRQHLAAWLYRRIDAGLRPLAALSENAFTGPARGLVFQLRENLGALARDPARALLSQIEPEDRRRLRQRGVRLGFVDIYVPALQKAERLRLRWRLAGAWHELAPSPPPPPDRALLRPEVALDEAFLAAVGYRAIPPIDAEDRPLAVRHDMLDRLAKLARDAAAAAPFAMSHAMTSLLGGDAATVGRVLRSLGYVSSESEEGPRWSSAPRPAGRWRRAQNRGQNRATARRGPGSGPEASPFAILRRRPAGS